MDGKQLKNSILQWAIQGKLVPQNPKDEPASKLLERIAAIRHSEQSEESSKRSKKASTSLRGAKATKQFKNPTSRIYRENGVWYEQVGTATPKDISDEIPFEIPESWEWVRLPMVGELNRGKSQARPRNDPSLFSNGTFPMIQTGDVARAETVISSCKSKYNEKGIAQSRIWPKGTICLTIAANIGDVAILGFDACFPDSVVGFNAYTPIDSNLFFLYALKCYKNILDELSRSTAQKNINIDILSKIFFPLPPLAEQKRIVAKLEQVLPLADEYGAAQEQLDKLNKELPEALKKSILQQAIQGKLVPQNPKDEPAQKLLDRITAARNGSLSPWSEAIGSTKRSKKSTPTSRIYCENGTWYEQIGNAAPKDISEDIPFEIPKNWTWSRLGYIGETITGSTPSKLNSNYLGSDIPFLSPGDISQFNSITSYNNQGLSNLGKSVARPVPAQTILQVCIGGSIGKSAIVDREVCFNQQINSITLKDIDYRYVYYVLQSKFFQDSIKAKATGTATPIINKSSWDRLLFPVAPLAEQKRIVTKLEQLFKVL